MNACARVAIISGFALVAAFAASCGGEEQPDASAAVSEQAISAATLRLTAAMGSSPSFGTVVIGANRMQTFMVSNIGTAERTSRITVSLVGGAFAVLPAAAGDCVSGTTRLVPGASCTVRVRFAPTVAGAATATLSARAQTGGTVNLALTGTGASPALLTISPGAVNFGSVTVGATSAPASLTVSNAGSSASSVLTIAVAGANATDFALSSGAGSCAGGTLAPGASCLIQVTFRPTTIGARSATVTVAATLGGTVSTQLSGTGKLPSGTFAEFAVPVSDDFALTGLTLGPDGNLYFCEGTIARMSLQGGSVGTITFLTAPFTNGPFMMARGPDSNLWVTELVPANVARMSVNGTGFAEFPVTGSPFGAFHIIAGPDGNLWFSEISGAATPPLFLHRITTAGVQLPVFSVGASYLTVGPDGNVWATENASNRLARISPAGAVAEFPIPTAASSPFGITAGPDGNIWFVESTANKIGRFSIATSTFAEFSIPSSSGSVNARYITAGPDGNLWFAEFDPNKVARISPAGAITEFTVPTASAGPLEIIAGPDGNLYFTEQIANAIGRISP